MKATIFDFARASFVDGPGIRTTVFFKGCNLRCAWCHNPESQMAKPQMMFYSHKCTGCGLCKEKCPNALQTCTLCGVCTLYCPSGAREICGKAYTVEEVLSEILKDKPFYQASGGVTFSGGECMLQLDFLVEILKRCKENGIHTAVDTAGNVPYSSFERVLPYTDLFLYDVKCWDSERHRKYTGVDNVRILENLKKLLTIEKEVWVRIPVIPTVNDNVDEMQQIKRFLMQVRMPDKVELLPYHTMGEHKYEAIQQKQQTFSVPDEEKLESLRQIFNKKEA